MKLSRALQLALTTSLSFFTASTVHAIDCTTCGLLIRPSAFTGISSTSPRTTYPLGPVRPDNFFTFRLSQTGKGDGKTLTSETDLLATYTNIPCATTQTVEFFFEPISDYSYSGYTKVEVYNVNGNLPRDTSGAISATWENMKGKTGTKVGSFQMPDSEATQVRTNFRIGPAACKSELNLRLTISNTGYKSGSVDYSQDYAGYVTGLKVRVGC